MRWPRPDLRPSRAPVALSLALGLALAALLPALALAQTGDAFAPFRYDPTRPGVLRLDGEIDVRTPFMLGAALRAHPGVTTLELHSPGGDIYQALTMVDTIRGAGLATRVAPDDRCHSACSFLFFAGTGRQALGALGVHQLSAPNQQSAQYVMNDVLDALNHLGVPDEVRRRMFQTPADEMYVFSPDELAALGFDDATPEPTADAAVAPAEPDAGPPVIVTVKPDGSGDYGSIAAAVRAAEAGTRILVYPGTYTGHVTVKTPVDIVGTGPREDIVWETTWPSLLRWEAAEGSLSGLTLRPAAAEPLTHRETALIDIRSGVPRVRDCDITALAEATAVIRIAGAAAAPVIEGNRIRGGQMGIQFDGGGGTAQENLVSRTDIGIGVQRSAALVRANQIRNVEIGIGLGRAAAGEVTDNEVRYCARGIAIRSTATARLGDNAVDTCETPVYRE